MQKILLGELDLASYCISKTEWNNDLFRKPKAAKNFLLEKSRYKWKLKLGKGLSKKVGVNGRFL